MPWINSVISDDRFTGIKSTLHAESSQIKAKEAVKKDKRWNSLETEPFAEIWV